MYTEHRIQGVYLYRTQNTGCIVKQNTEYRVCSYTEHRIQGVYRTQNTGCIVIQNSTGCIPNTEYRVYTEHRIQTVYRTHNTDCILNTENRDLFTIQNI